jgi:hypothetical protein
MWRRVVSWKLTDMSDEYVASMFSVKNTPRKVAKMRAGDRSRYNCYAFLWEVNSDESIVYGVQRNGTSGYLWSSTMTLIYTNVFCLSIMTLAVEHNSYWRCRVSLVGTDVSEERIASVIRVTRIGELILAETSNRGMRTSVATYC